MSLPADDLEPLISEIDVLPPGDEGRSTTDDLDVVYDDLGIENSNGGDNDNDGDPPKRPLTEGAVLYLEEAKNVLSQRPPEVYKVLEKLVGDVEAESVSPSDAVEQVMPLLEGFNQLILGFNAFLPDDAKMELSLVDGSEMPRARGVARSRDGSSSSIDGSGGDGGGGGSGGGGGGSAQAVVLKRQRSTISDEMDTVTAYIVDIRTSYAAKPQIYNDFMRLVKKHRELPNRNDEAIVREVIKRVSAMFKDEPRLILGFKNYLPTAEQAVPLIERAAQDAEDELTHRFENACAVVASEADSGSGSGSGDGEAAIAKGDSSNCRLEELARQGKAGFDLTFRAHAYMDAIQARFYKSHRAIFDRFHEICGQYDARRDEKWEVKLHWALGAVLELFQDHLDLATEFVWFLPAFMKEEAQKGLDKAKREYEERLVLNFDVSCNVATDTGEGGEADSDSAADSRPSKRSAAAF